MANSWYGPTIFFIWPSNVRAWWIRIFLTSSLDFSPISTRFRASSKVNAW